jgi:hypothetical protein
MEFAPMQTILSYLFLEPFPVDWLIQDVIAILLSLVVLFFIIQREKRPFIVILELFTFIFIYTSIYENAQTAFLGFAWLKNRERSVVSTSP